jgi:phospholipase C
MSKTKSLVRGALPAVLLASILGIAAHAAPGDTSTVPAATPASGHGTTTPIEHVVVIFQENISFDHYFGTYPNAENLKGESVFVPAGGTPSVNGLAGPLFERNPNSAVPFRLSRAQEYTCDQDHDYTPEQMAANGGLLDHFPESVGVGGSSCDFGHGSALTMGYYDGSTVTALWNYAQHFALNDNSYGTTFGPSTVGALNLVAGQTGNVDTNHMIGDNSSSAIGTTVIGDPDPFYDDCGSPGQLAVTGTNIGDLLNAAGLTWGWFQGGFAPSSRTASGAAVCGSKTPNLGGALQADYSAHHEPFEYFQQSANPHHLPPSSVAAIGHGDQANHQYDLTNFFAALHAGNLPAVSFLKAKKAQDGHAGYSSPLDEQVFLVTVLNALQQSPEWRTTAVFILWDDSDGWYDHAMSPIVNPSATTADALSGNGACGSGTPLGGIQGRCGYGPRLPFLVISPYAKVNFVDHTTTDQSSAIHFIEDNWSLGRIGGGSFDAISGSVTNMFDFRHLHANPVLLNPNSGVVTN